MEELALLDACELVKSLHAGTVSAREVLDAHMAQVAQLNPLLNALVTVDEPGARRAAEDADARRARGESLGPLHGLPVGVKDIHAVSGLRTTFGSLVHEHHVSTSDTLLVERVRRAGGIILGKTNTPEFAAGSHTYNAVFGTTANPYDLSRSAGGSSGGSAVAVACGLVSLADGSDLGGSLRNPAAFNNVVGFRPSPGRVPRWPTASAWDTLAVQGPMARSVADAALLMSVVTGPDPRSPISLEADSSMFDSSVLLNPDLRGTRVAVSHDLGRYPVDGAVRDVVSATAEKLAELGATVTDAAPDFTDADEIFRVLRAARFANSYGHLLRDARRDLLNDDVVWNIEQGFQLDGLATTRAEASRTQLFQRIVSFFQDYDALVTPSAPTFPFPSELRYPSEIDGVKQEDYLEWMGICFAISVAGVPAMAIPGGFTDSGLPIGVQVVGPPRQDREVVRISAAFEAATGYGKRRPAILTGRAR